MITRDKKGHFVKGFGFWTGKKRPGLKTKSQFVKGFTPWNKGTERPETRGINNPGWKGNDVGYTGIHAWVARRYGKPKECVHCGKTEGRLEWANKTGKYLRNIKDWLQLCHKCHIRYDKERGSWGKATKLWKLK